MKNRLKVLRAERDWSQQDLADKLGVSRQTINAIEQGRYSPSLEVAFQIARVFKVPLDEVFQYPEGESRGRPRSAARSDRRTW